MNKLFLYPFLFFTVFTCFAGRWAFFPTNSTFTPASLSGLVFWVDANNPASINTGTPANNDPVANWNDLSVTGANFVQVTGGSQPIYKTGQQNSLPAVTFTSGHFLQQSGAQLVGTGSASFTIFAIVDYTLPATPPCIMSFHAGGSGNDPQFVFDNAAGFQNIYFGAKLTSGAFGAVRSQTSYGSSSTYYAVSLTYNGGGPGAGNYQWYASNISQTTVVGADDTTTSALNIMGQCNNAASGPLNGGIGELFIYNRVLNSTELSQVQTLYINPKWNL